LEGLLIEVAMHIYSKGWSICPSITVP